MAGLRPEIPGSVLISQDKPKTEVKKRHGVTIIPKDAVLTSGPKFVGVAIIGNGQTSQMLQEQF